MEHSTLSCYYLHSLEENGGGLKLARLSLSCPRYVKSLFRNYGKCIGYVQSKLPNGCQDCYSSLYIYIAQKIHQPIFEIVIPLLPSLQAQWWCKQTQRLHHSRLEHAWLTLPLSHKLDTSGSNQPDSYKDFYKLVRFFSMPSKPSFYIFPMLSCFRLSSTKGLILEKMVTQDGSICYLPQNTLTSQYNNHWRCASRKYYTLSLST